MANGNPYTPQFETAQPISTDVGTPDIIPESPEALPNVLEIFNTSGLFEPIDTPHRFIDQKIGEQDQSLLRQA